MTSDRLARRASPARFGHAILFIGPASTCGHSTGRRAARTTLRRTLSFALLLTMALSIGCSYYSPNLGVTPTQSSTLLEINPSSEVAGSVTSPATLSITVTGASFVDGSTVLWNNAALTTTFVNSGELVAVVTAAQLATPQTITVGVLSPGNTTPSTAGNNLSNFLPFTILASSPAAPSISLLSPSSVAVGSGGSTGCAPTIATCFNITLTGSGFTPESSVLWNGQPCLSVTNPGPPPTTVQSCVTTSYVSATGLTASVPGGTNYLSFDAAVPTVQPQISVSDPESGTSNTAPFTITQTAASGAVLQSSAGRRAVVPIGRASQVSPPRYIAVVGPVSVPGGSSVQGVFLEDTCQGAAAGCTQQKTLVSVPTAGAAPDGDSYSPSISSDGRFVAFASQASNLVPGDTNGVADVFLRDTCVGAGSACTPATTRVSVGADGLQANGASTSVAIGPYDRYLVFESSATNLGESAAGSTSSASSGTFLHDTCLDAPACTPSNIRLH